MKYIFLFTVVLFCIKVNAQNVGIGIDTPKAKLHTTCSVRHETLRGKETRVVFADSFGNLKAETGFSYMNDSIIAILDNTCNGVSRFNPTYAVGGEA